MTATYALIPAAGRGARFSTDGSNKVFALLGGRPILHWTVSAFAEHAAVDGIVVVTGPSDISRCREALAGLPNVMAIIPGGATRQDSVQIGLFALGAEPDDLVLVHDGARPLVTSGVIDRCIATARVGGSAVAALPVHDTLKRADPSHHVQETVDRTDLWAVQTPQAFRYQTLLNATVVARDAYFSGTDEASLVENAGDIAVRLVQGDSENIKITSQADLAHAENILALRQNMTKAAPRIGFGYDIHRLVPGRRLILGGVEIPDAQGRGLDGHSDADVLLHALCDALLGAAGLPDIGTLYPNTDAAYAGIDSIKLLQDVSARLHAQGMAVVNVDMTVIAESPKIAPYISQMRATLGTVLGLESACVGIKATTNEGIGSLGRSEGIAAHAVACIATLEHTKLDKEKPS